MLERRRAVGMVDRRGRSLSPEVRLLAIGEERFSAAIEALVASSRDVVSVCSGASRDVLVETRDRNRRVVEGGTRLRSWYDVDRSDPETAGLLLSQPWLTGHWTVAPVETKILDNRAVLVEGPRVEGRRSVLLTTHHRAVAAATAYWQAVRARSVPLELVESDNPLRQMSERQRETARMLADGLTDEEIARRLDVSVRTVRYDVTRLRGLLQASSRFGIGLALGRLGFDPHTQGPARPPRD
jgi:DNA-binding CsgD family transcriptional regulator